MRRHLLPGIASAHAVGVVAAAAAVPPATVAGVTALVLAAAALGVRAGARGAGLAILAAALATGILRASVETRRGEGPPALAVEPAAPRRGRIADGPWPTDDGWWFDVALDEAGDGGAGGGLVRLHFGGDARGYGVGDHVAFRAALRPRRRSGNPGAPAPRRGAPRRSGTVAAADGLVRIPGPQPGTLVRLRRARDALALEVRDRAGARAGGVLAALGLGARRLVPPDERERLAATGTAHTLAVSGLHLGLVGLWLHLLLRSLLLRSAWLVLRVRSERLLAALTLAGLAAFTLWTGAEIATVRALVMATLFLGARALGRRTDGPTALSLAVLGLLTVDPSTISEVSFQLSVSAVAAILWAAPAGERLTRRIVPGVTAGPTLGRAGRSLATALWVSAAAAVGTVPVLAVHFHRVAPLSLLANLMAVPLLALVVLPLALLACILAAALPGAWVEPALTVPGAVVTAWLDAIDAIAAVAPDPTVTPSPWGVTAMVLGGALLLRAPLATRRWLAATAGAGLFLLPLCLTGPGSTPATEPGGFVATVLDVGHGVATIVRFPDGATWLVDGGGRADGGPGPGRTRVVPALRALGVDRVDVMVASHGDADHAGGLVAVATAVEIGALWTGGPPRSTAARRLERVVEARGGRVERVTSDTPVARPGGVPVRVLWPPPPTLWPPDDDPPCENDRSVVLRIGGSGGRLLLPGDIEAPAESALLASGRDVVAEVVVAPHHGSATSSTPAFVAATRPRVVVWSHGPGRRPPLPARIVDRRYRETGAYAFDTSLDGALEVRVEGGVVSVCGLAPPRADGLGRRCHATAVGGVL